MEELRDAGSYEDYRRTVEEQRERDRGAFTGEKPLSPTSSRFEPPMETHVWRDNLRVAETVARARLNPGEMVIPIIWVTGQSR